MAARDRTSPDDVFINCPFDPEYESTFRALIFAIYACGFRPRSALELEDGGQTRIEKLFNIIDACRQDHGGHPRRAIEKTRNWLTNVSRRVLPSAAKINRLYEKFLTHLASMADKLEFPPGDIPYADFDNLVVGWLREAEPEPEPDAQQGQK